MAKVLLPLHLSKANIKNFNMIGLPKDAYNINNQFLLFTSIIGDKFYEFHVYWGDVFGVIETKGKIPLMTKNRSLTSQEFEKTIYKNGLNNLDVSQFNNPDINVNWDNLCKYIFTRIIKSDTTGLLNSLSIEITLPESIPATYVLNQDVIKDIKSSLT